jgi:hypothetical protein
MAIQAAIQGIFNLDGRQKDKLMRYILRRVRRTDTY